MTVVLFCQPLNDSSESLIDLLPLPASIALQIKKDGGQEAVEIGQNSTARNWALELSIGAHLSRATAIRLWREKKGKKGKDVLFGCATKLVRVFSYNLCRM